VSIVFSSARILAAVPVVLAAATLACSRPDDLAKLRAENGALVAEVARLTAQLVSSQNDREAVNGELRRCTAALVDKVSSSPVSAPAVDEGRREIEERNARANELAAKAAAEQARAATETREAEARREYQACLDRHGHLSFDQQSATCRLLVK
jgi:hypothetical protein